MRVGIYLLAFVEQDFSIGTFLAADEEYQIVRSCEFPDVGNAVGYLPAYGVVIFESDIGGYMFFYVFHDFLKFIQRLGGLRVEAYALAEIQ